MPDAEFISLVYCVGLVTAKPRAELSHGLRCNTKGIPYPNHSNVVFVLQSDPTYGASYLWYDQFLDRVFYANSPVREWRDDDDTKVAVDMQDRYGIVGLGQTVVEKAVLYVARQRTRHAVRDYLEALAWDGVERLEHAFSEYWGAADDEYTRAASKNFLVGMVARILKPGCKLDTMPVFEGPQGAKKSTALEVLGGDWYSTTHETVGSKDFLQGLRGKWLLEIAELHSFTKADVRATKNTLSTRNDDYRRSHGHNVQRYPRECVFAGTSNPKDWGNDDTGLRRFWPVECGDIRIDLLSAARDQIFAEAVHVVMAGATWWEMPSGTAAVQASRQQYDEWTSSILEWINRQPTTEGFRMSTMLFEALKVTPDKLDMKTQIRAGRVLRLAGYEKRDERVGQQIVKVWRPTSNKTDSSVGVETFS